MPKDAEIRGKSAQMAMEIATKEDPARRLALQGRDWRRESLLLQRRTYITVPFETAAVDEYGR